MSTIALVLIPIIALLCWPLWNIYSLSNLNTASESESSEFGNCQVHALPYGEWQCEDFAPISDSQIVFACGNREGHKKWFPVRGNFDSTADVDDSLFLYDIESGQVQPVRIRDQQSVGDVRLHGMTVDLDKNQVWLINHQRAGSVVDLFQLNSNRTELSLVKRFRSSHITNPNDLVIYQDSGFFVTNDHRYRSGIMRFIEDMFMMPWGTVVYCPKDDQDKCRVVADGLSFPNGIALSSFGKGQEKLLVSETLGTAIRSYIIVTKNQGKHVSLRPSTITALDFMPDNIITTSEGQVFVAGHPNLMAYLASVADEKTSPGFIELAVSFLRKRGLVGQYAGSKVVELLPHETDWWLGDRLQSKNIYNDASGIVEASSSAAVINGTLYIGTVAGRGGIAVCPRI